MTELGGMSGAATELVLWAGSVKSHSFEDRIVAAGAGGFAHTSLFPHEVRRWRESGRSDGELRGLFEAGGIRIAVVDPLISWWPDAKLPPGLPEDHPATGPFEPSEIFDMAVAVGAETVAVVALFAPRVDPARGARYFAAACDRASERGLRLGLEAIPHTGIPELALAWQIVERAGRENGGVVLDAWHFFRGEPDYEVLGSIPGEKIFAVQLDDAPLEPYHDTAFESLHLRQLPGEGELDLGSFIRTVLASGTDALFGPEVFSDQLSTIAASELGHRLGESTREVLTAAGVFPTA